MQLIFVLLVVLLKVVPSFAQLPPLNVPATLNSSNQTGPINPGYWDLRGTGINVVAFTWNTNGTVSAGACALQGSTDTITWGTTIIAAQTVTSSGGPTSLTSGVTSNYIRLRCTTPIVGSGSVQFRVMGWQISPSSGSVTQGTSPWVMSCTSENCTVRVVDSNGDPILNDDIAFVTPTGYTTTVTISSSNTVAVTDNAIVTVSAGTRIVVNQIQFTCNASTSAKVTFSIGFGTSTLPTSGAGLIWEDIETTATTLSGISKGSGWPNVVGFGASDEDLRVTHTVPTGGSCSTSVTYRTESSS